MDSDEISTLAQTVAQQIMEKTDSPVEAIQVVTMANTGIVEALADEVQDGL